MSQNNGANGTNTPPVGSENINIDIITLTRFLTEEQTKHKEATGDFTYAMDKTQKLKQEALVNNRI